jgi:hypothetical protein
VVATIVPDVALPSAMSSTLQVTLVPRLPAPETFAVKSWAPPVGTTALAGETDIVMLSCKVTLAEPAIFRVYHAERRDYHRGQIGHACRSGELLHPGTCHCRLKLLRLAEDGVSGWRLDNHADSRISRSTGKSASDGQKCHEQKNCNKLKAVTKLTVVLSRSTSRRDVWRSSFFFLSCRHRGVR